jgi:hypothetical protein
MVLAVVVGAGGPVPVVPAAPSLPGTEEVTSLLQGLAQYGLLAAVAALLLGGALWAWASRNGAFQRVHQGQMLVLGGLIGALITGAATVLVNFAYSAGTAFK